jgi:uncharacterized protein (TIGR02145 family)
MKKLIVLCMTLLSIVGGCSDSSSNSNSNEPSSGVFIDPRDSKSYKYVIIGKQKWMAENLNFNEESTSKCYENSDENCSVYGRLYDWKTVMNSENPSEINSSIVQGICPSGWHVPQRSEWVELAEFSMDYIESEEFDSNSWKKIAPLLKDSLSWKDFSGITTLNTFGFNAQAGGGNLNGTHFYNINGEGLWWSASSISSDSILHQSLHYDYNSFSNRIGAPTSFFSLRCIED